MNLSWDSLNVHSEIKEVIRKEFGFEQMTAVQAASIPLFITNKDLSVEAVTGSGKTIAFVVPILEILLRKASEETIKKHDIGAIVISPTRELAVQIHEVFRRFTEHLKSSESPKVQFRSMLLIGGSNPFKDIATYMAQGANIVVSTPGRLFDVLEKSEHFSERVRKCLEVLVLDEADQLLSLGFEKKLGDILAFLPKLRRTSLFSATQTKELDDLIRVGLRNPVKIEIGEKSRQSNKGGGGGSQVQMPNRLLNRFIVLSSCEEKVPYLVNFVRQQQNTARHKKYLIFMSTCAQVNYFEKLLGRFLNAHHQHNSNSKSNSKSSNNNNSHNNQITLLKLHRKLKAKRQKIFEQFRETEHCLLLCTDVMARGVDIPQVDWVVHFDLPLTIESYVHRCGRSGHQVNAAGNSLLLCLPHERPFVELVQEKGVDIEEEKEEVTSTEEEVNNNTTSNLREEVLKWAKAEARRNIHFYELSVQAFVSFVRTYASKHCLSKFLFKQTDVVDIANAYALLKMPAMPELRQAKHLQQKGATAFRGSAEDTRTVNNFKDILYAKKNAGAAANDPEGDEEGETTRRHPHSKFGFKRNPEMQEKFERECTGGKLKGKKKREFMDALEQEELLMDARVVKKLKRGAISSKQFEEHFGI
ncbi:PREDICTED: ATP-dependent RNA helicase DDX55-like [Rhagoletis zephyria]|uniref:ATP-dependent RNA helicase DDX55-like n=1 Tax=Rhagoletis zephyria TaxID=28612 RepID=UPI00081125AB|nr:PREDICTED: ATP-dependent RNA helicase DDX55-like [Rhagoletis zephyria]